MSLDGDRPSNASVDFRLVESGGSWRLVIGAGARLRETLAAQSHSATPLVFSVLVEPNLVPGEPFDVRVEFAPAGRRKE